MDEKTAGVLLAAGGSNRLGYPKQLISFQGIPLISHMISVIKKGGIDDLFVVVGSHSEAIISCIKENVQIIHNPNWEEGLSASIRSALAVIEKEYDAAMVFIIDQPYLHPALIIKMLATVKMSQTKIIAARAAGQQTHPVVYRRDIYPDLLSLKGDRGGKEIIRKNRISWVDWPDPAILQDIDTPADAESINHQHQYQNPNPH
jgi:molybdenum cofactor cytidylyltransferase